MQDNVFFFYLLREYMPLPLCMRIFGEMKDLPWKKDILLFI